MVQNLSVVTREQFHTTLGHSLSATEFQNCLNQVKYITPKVGKFWQGTEVEPGVYIVIAGKVRLLDTEGELIATLEAGSAFGEFTLFPDANFQPYTARASVNLHLCFVPGDVLLPLMAKYPQIRQIKTSLYDAGATFALMSGSGSSVFALFSHPVKLPELEKNNLVFYGI